MTKKYISLCKIGLLNKIIQEKSGSGKYNQEGWKKGGGRGTTPNNFLPGMYVYEYVCIYILLTQKTSQTSSPYTHDKASFLSIERKWYLLFLNF